VDHDFAQRRLIFLAVAMAFAVPLIAVSTRTVRFMSVVRVATWLNPIVTGIAGKVHRCPRSALPRQATRRLDAGNCRW
jgi:hypothetical protein